MVTPQDVLLEHQHLNSGGCSCERDGRKPELLGQSHSQHVLDELRAAGFAIVRDYTVAATVEPEHGGRGCTSRYLLRAPAGDRWLTCERAATHPGVHAAGGPGGVGVEWPDTVIERCSARRGSYFCHALRGHPGEHQDPVRGISWGDT